MRPLFIFFIVFLDSFLATFCYARRIISKGQNNHHESQSNISKFSMVLILNQFVLFLIKTGFSEYDKIRLLLLISYSTSYGLLLLLTYAFFAILQYYNRNQNMNFFDAPVSELKTSLSCFVAGLINSFFFVFFNQLHH